MIKAGERLPDVTFTVMEEDGVAKKSTDNVFGGRRVALFAVPGAFTPTCHMNHLPGFIDNLDSLKAKGIDSVACTSVNDIFVMDAWAKASEAEGIEFLADGSAEFATAIGLEMDSTPFGMGIRSKRYSMIVNDGVIEMLNIGDKPGEAVITGAETLLAAL